MEKQRMIDSQLIARGIEDYRLLELFSSVEKEDYLGPQARRLAYSDNEIPIGEDHVCIRSYALALILGEVIQHPYKNMLIVGDVTGYVATLFSKLISEVTIGTFQNSEIENLRSKVRQAKVGLINDIKDKFDLIFLDGGIFKVKTRNMIKKFLSPNGNIIYFDRIATSEFTPKTFDFFHVFAILENFVTKRSIFELPLFFPSTPIA